MVKASKEAKVSLEQLKAVGNAMPGGFVMYTAAAPESIIYINEELVGIYGCDDEADFLEFTKGVFPGLVHPDDIMEIERDIVKQINSHNNDFDHVQYRALKKSGEEIFIDDYGRLLNTEEYGDVYFVFIQDITAMKKLQDENIRMQLQLEQERQLETVREEFLFHISHDIRTPMNAISGYTSLALNHIDDEESLRENLEKIKQSSNQMLLMVDNLLDINEMKKTEVVIDAKPRNLSKDIDALSELFIPLAKAKNISMNFDSTLKYPKLWLDLRLFQRIFHCILDNAIKFTEAGGNVKLYVTQTPAKDDMINTTFVIEDTGIGMSPEFIKKACTPFERELTSTLSGQEGVGIGLSVAKGFINALNGVIDIKSSKGEGTTVTITLPFKQFIWEEKKKTIPKDCRILIVEDIELNRVIAQTVLEDEGFLTEYAENGKEGYEAVLNNEPGYYSLVLMDIQMPVMDGYESTRAIRGIDRDDAATLPIVALSANVGEDAIKESLASGMNQHIAKPFKPDQLIDIIMSYVE